MLRLIKRCPEFVDGYKAYCREAYDNHIKYFVPSNPENIDENRYMKTKEWYDKKELGAIEGQPISFHFWAVDGDAFIGEFQLRTEYTEEITAGIGNIGYAVRVSKQGKGYGTEILRQGLAVAREHGMKKVLLNINKENAASIRVCEKLGGVLMDEINAFNKNEGEHIMRRYWIYLEAQLGSIEMITLAEYLKNPCAALPIPYWKNKTLKLPENIKTVHSSRFNIECLKHYKDEEYFRLRHSLDNIGNTASDGFYIKTAEESDIETIVSIINRSYTDIVVSAEQMNDYKTTPVYDKNLWILVYSKKTDMPVGCGIADYDAEAREGILEWIQVLPDFRRKSVGQLIVNELLKRMSAKASFVTVSGKVSNETKPEILYRKCGFTGDDIWHILYKI